ncbi:hypothetical protein GCM10022245_18840 [Streptomyces mayteni]
MRRKGSRKKATVRTSVGTTNGHQRACVLRRTGFAECRSARLRVPRLAVSVSVVFGMAATAYSQPGRPAARAACSNTVCERLAADSGVSLPLSRPVM